MGMATFWMTFEKSDLATRLDDIGENSQFLELRGLSSDLCSAHGLVSDYKLHL